MTIERATSGSAVPVFVRQAARCVPIAIVALTLAVSSFASLAEARPFVIGTQLEFPVPGRDVGDAQLGVGAGMTYTDMINANVGVGMDAVYHYWPASARYTGAFDHYLMSSRFESLDGTEWAFSALQMTGHFQLMVPMGRHSAPWAKVGAGLYVMNLNLDERTSPAAAGWFLLKKPGDVLTVPGAYAAVGCDFHVGSPITLGLDATLHYLASHQKAAWGPDDLPDFVAFTIGTRVLFGLE